jgi:hypothetical protein
LVQPAGNKILPKLFKRPDAQINKNLPTSSDQKLNNNTQQPTTQQQQKQRPPETSMAPKGWWAHPKGPLLYDNPPDIFPGHHVLLNLLKSPRHNGSAR